MRGDEKACPRCKETIKKAAHLCKNCGHRFPEEEISAGSTKTSSSNRATAIGVIVVLGLFLLAGRSCSSDENPTDAEVGRGGEASYNPYADVSRQQLWIETSKDAIRERLKDADSAKFRDVHFYSGGSAAVACGEVNAKNALGGYTGYERFVAAGSKLAFLASDMPSPSEMDKVWKEMCVKAPIDEA